MHFGSFWLFFLKCLPTVWRKACVYVGRLKVQLWQMKCRRNTWVCTNIPSSATASVTAKLYMHARKLNFWKRLHHTKESNAWPQMIFRILSPTTVVQPCLMLYWYTFCNLMYRILICCCCCCFFCFCVRSHQRANSLLTLRRTLKWPM